MTSSETHRRLLGQFIRLEQEVGGPDPHMTLAAELARGRTVEGKAWTAACYVGPYVIASTEAILHYWPDVSLVLSNPSGWRAWIDSEWDRIWLRRERRAINTPRRFADHMLNVARFLDRELDRLVEVANPYTAWDRLSTIAGNGRYGTLKFYEILHRLGIVGPAMPDIRPDGGRTPRQALAMIYPQAADVLTGGNSQAHLVEANHWAALARSDLADDGVEDLDWYVLEVGLCEYRQAWKGGQYPGRAHDSELGHYNRIAPMWPEVSFRLLDLRRRLFPRRSLGELNGWDGRRDLGDCPSRFGYMWSDLLYDYASTTDLADPVPA